MTKAMSGWQPTSNMPKAQTTPHAEAGAHTEHREIYRKADMDGERGEALESVCRAKTGRETCASGLTSPTRRDIVAVSFRGCRPE